MTEGPREAEGGRWTRLRRCENVVEAEMLAARLRDAGVQARISGEHVGIFGPGWSGGHPGRGIELLVPADRLGEARQALDEEA